MIDILVRGYIDSGCMDLFARMPDSSIYVFSRPDHSRHIKQQDHDDRNRVMLRLDHRVEQPMVDDGGDQTEKRR